MDRLIYVAMTGAKNIMSQQASVSHNLANATTDGFRAEIHRFRTAAVQGEGLPTRAFAVDSSIATDFSPGTLVQTGKPLDVAVQGQGWLTVQARDGREAYTRAGSFQITANGQLQTGDGLDVLGDGGAIAIPPGAEIAIAKDGTISALERNGGKVTATTVGRLKLVNPPEAQLARGEDGLFRLTTGGDAEQDELVQVAPGFVEGSNVSAPEMMVQMITLARHFETQMKLIQNADANDRSATQLLSMNR